MKAKISMKNSLENLEEATAEQPQQQWFIDLEWLERNNRSFSLLAKRCLCPKCSKRLKANGKEIPVDDLLAAIKKCCSKTPSFITERTPILESVFRLLLAAGNQPLNLEELSKQLSERRGGDTIRTSVSILSRLLSPDRYYGFCLLQK